MNIEEILQLQAQEAIAALKNKTDIPPSWQTQLQKEYDPKLHPINNKNLYPDVVTDEGIEPVTRVALNLQKLATKRMCALTVGIPAKRVYKPENEQEQQAADLIESIFEAQRINSLNRTRLIPYFAACEMATLWYAIPEEHNEYTVPSKIKIRTRVFSPMTGHELYPLFDEYGMMMAFSVGYRVKQGKSEIQVFETFTKDLHIRWKQGAGGWQEEVREAVTYGKIPVIYAKRDEPIWEDTSPIVYELEWSLSRNGNYLRKNSKPILSIYADEEIEVGKEGSQDKEFKGVFQFPQGSKLEYVTWSQSTETLKFHVDALRSWFFTQLQLPDWSYDKMSQQALSGESRKQMFTDAMTKVEDEAGDIRAFMEREVNVVKAFAAIVAPGLEQAINSLRFKVVITPYTINDEKETINNLQAANGGKALISHLESIELFGHSSNPKATLEEMQEEDKVSAFEPTI